MRLAFTRFASWSSDTLESFWAFIVAVALIVSWLVTGPIFAFSSDWQLAINHAHDDHHLPDGVRDPEHTDA